MLKLSTVGNATLIAYDKEPILTTDPWISDEDHAYFGSWIGTHKIPKDKKDDILNSKFIWFSHGHPDHINPVSINRFINKEILLPDHYGSRIYKDLVKQKFNVRVLKDKKWYQLSKNIKIQCLTNWLQDSILILDINGNLFLNLNDAGYKYYSYYLRKISKDYKKVYLLSLSGGGDADMINFYHADGRKVSRSTKDNEFVGNQLSDIADTVGANLIVPFSSFHQYQRSDSIWAQEHTVHEDYYKKGIRNNHIYIEPFSEIDCINNNVNNLNPEKNKIIVKKPEDFNDNWSDQLDKNEIKELQKYFFEKELLHNTVKFITFVVGKKEHRIEFKNKLNCGVTFEVPRNSLLLSIRYKIFDDLLIGNFMKTTLHNMQNLYEKRFNYIITKWSDNGGINNKFEYENYFQHYSEKAEKIFFIIIS